ncbi:MAG: aminotransferase class III-fold pyridoxal phosphate-dependent enzyme [Alphaproteobacteria bacterium]|nr:aminotransferase class III-fold pyridoxal phosphate-dependent enzyme [Alphaproteobacteria bacterium]
MGGESDNAILEQLQDLDRRHHLHPFTDAQALTQATPFLIDHGQGAYVTGQGVRLLDAMAGLGCVNVGYGRAEIAQAAAEAIQALSYYHSFFAVSNPYTAALAGKIAALAPDHLNKVFFANSGSEANETLMKLALLYWRAKGKANKRIFITRDYSYHGSTIAVTRLNGNQAMLDDFGLGLDDGVKRAMAPYWYRCGKDMSADEFGLFAAKDIETKILEAGADNVAAVIAEPVQGTMGGIVPPKTYWPEVERICREHGVLLIADEVVTGFGRTGNWFAQETFGFNADMMALAKGLSSGYAPISAAVISDEIASTIEQNTKILQHGFTTSAHPVTSAIALKNIDILEQEHLVENIRDNLGPLFGKSMVGLEDHPLVGEVRVNGLIAGVELTRNKETREQFPLEANVCNHVSQMALLRGLIVRPAGNVLVLCPPFIIKPAEIEFMTNILRDSLDETYRVLSAA